MGYLGWAPMHLRQAKSRVINFISTNRDICSSIMIAVLLSPYLKNNEGSVALCYHFPPRPQQSNLLKKHCRKSQKNDVSKQSWAKANRGFNMCSTSIKNKSTSSTIAKDWWATFTTKKRFSKPLIRPHKQLTKALHVYTHHTSQLIDRDMSAPNRPWLISWSIISL